MRGQTLAFVAMTMLLLPGAAASDPFYDASCIDQAPGCIGPGTCTVAACVPRSCQPLFYCYGTLLSADDCATNATIRGETCQAAIGAGARTNTPGQAAWVGVAVSDGHVDAFNLPNTWLAPAVEASLLAGGIRFGTTHVGLYRSVIKSDHTWTNLALVVGQNDGLTGSEALVVSVHLLDGVPEGCEARTAHQTLARCPSQREILP